STDPDHVLDPKRLLVASTSNFGASPVSGGGAPGSILSLDDNGGASFALPADFARSGGQAAAADGKVILYTAQSAPFENNVNLRLFDAGPTSDLPAVSLPLGISFN